MTEREYSRLFRRHYLPLGMFALRYCGETAEAEDIVQEAFVKVWQKFRSNDSPPDIRQYLYAVVRNIAVDRIRMSSRQPEYSLSDMEIPEDSLVTEEQIDTSERDARIWREIGRLPERCRQVFLLSKRNGLSNKEIADELGISVKTVENQMTKALAHLRDSLASLKPGPSICLLLPFL